jgi:hypothetical protein
MSWAPSAPAPPRLSGTFIPKPWAGRWRCADCMPTAGGRAVHATRLIRGIRMIFFIEPLSARAREPTDPLCHQLHHKRATPQLTAAPRPVRGPRFAPRLHDLRASTRPAEIAPSHSTCAARSTHRHAYDSAHWALLRYGRLGRCTSASHHSVALHSPPEGLYATSRNGRVHCLSSIIPRFYLG